MSVLKYVAQCLIAAALIGGPVFWYLLFQMKP